MNHRQILVAVVVGAVLMTGCVTGRRNITLATPESPAASMDKGAIAVTQSTDARQFENKPARPSIPSVNGDVTKMSKEQLNVMVGRQRNSYGRAMGDIQLASGETVESHVRKLVTEGLKRRGYATSSSSSSNTAQVRIEEFWAWFTPGFSSVTFEAQLKAVVSLNVKGTKTDLVVTGYGKNAGQMASNANWQLAYTRAFEDFLKNMDSGLAGAKL